MFEDSTDDEAIKFLFNGNFYEVSNSAVRKSKITFSTHLLNCFSFQINMVAVVVGCES